MPRARFEISLLGEPSFLFDGAPWLFGRRRTLPLLAYLVTHAGQQLSRESVAALMWPEATIGEGRANLRRFLYEIQSKLPAIDGVDWIATTTTTLGWNPASPVWIDVAEFVSSKAVDLYRGDFLASYDDDWILSERARLHAKAMEALLERTLAARARRDYAEAGAHAERMLVLDEWREDAVRELMTARYEAGDRTAALAIYERFAQRLRNGMNVEPMIETLALRDAMLAGLALDAPLPPVVDLSERVDRGIALPFVGRSAPLDLLCAAWTRAARKTGSLVFVSGEAGIGKSRLAAELAATVTRQGGRTLVGLTSSPQRAPYQPLVDALRRGLPFLADASLDPLWLAVLEPLIPEVASLRDSLPVIEQLEPQAARARLNEAIARAFSAMSRTRPLLLVIEDIHWAQADTVEALAFLARRVGSMPLLIVACYRDELDAGNPVVKLRRELQAEHRAASVALARLNEQDFAHMVQAAALAVGSPTDFAAVLFEACDGNPLFASQLIEAFVETGALPRESGRFSKISDAIASRLGQLDDETRAIAEVAATVGREFSVDLVGAAGGWDERGVLNALGMLMDRRIVRETGAPGLEYSFTHAVIATAIYSSSSLALRSKRHRRIAQLLERTNAPLATPASIASHYESAGDLEEAGRSYTRAAQAALDVFAGTDAVIAAIHALALVTADRDRFDALSVGLRAQVRFGDPARAREMLAEFETLALRLGFSERELALELGVEAARLAGDRALQRSKTDAMLALANETQNQRLLVKALHARGRWLQVTANLTDAEGAFREALTLALELEDRALALELRERIVRILILRGHIDAAMPELQLMRKALENSPQDTPERLSLLTTEIALAEIIEDSDYTQRTATALLGIARRMGDIDTQARAHAMLAWAAANDPPVMRENYAKAVEILEARGHRQWLGAALANQGAIELRLGNIEESVRLSTAATDLFAETFSLGLVATKANMCEAELLRGRREGLLALADDVLARGMVCEERRLKGEAMTISGAAYCACGEAERGLQLLRDGVAMHRELNIPNTLGNELCLLIDALREAGLVEEAATYAQELQQLFEQEPKVARYPTRICLTLSRLARATDDEGSSRSWLDRGRALLSERLAAFSDPEDAERYANLPFNRDLELGVTV